MILSMTEAIKLKTVKNVLNFPYLLDTKYSIKLLMLSYKVEIKKQLHLNVAKNFTQEFFKITSGFSRKY